MTARICHIARICHARICHITLRIYMSHMQSAGLAYLFTLTSFFDSAGRQFADLSVP